MEDWRKEENKGIRKGESERKNKIEGNLIKKWNWWI